MFEYTTNTYDCEAGRSTNVKYPKAFVRALLTDLPLESKIESATPLAPIPSADNIRPLTDTFDAVGACGPLVNVQVIDSPDWAMIFAI